MSLQLQKLYGSFSNQHNAISIQIGAHTLDAIPIVKEDSPKCVTISQFQYRSSEGKLILKNVSIYKNDLENAVNRCSVIIRRIFIDLMKSEEHKSSLGLFSKHPNFCIALSSEGKMTWSNIHMFYKDCKEKIQFNNETKLDLNDAIYISSKPSLYITRNKAKKITGHILSHKIEEGASKMICKAIELKTDKPRAFYFFVRNMLIMSSPNEEFDKLQKEAEIMQEMKKNVSPYVAGPKSIYRTDYNKPFGIGPLHIADLLNYLNKNRLDKNTVDSFFGQILSLVNSFHNKDYVHQDIKLENILVGKQNRLYVADLENCTKVGSERTILEGTEDNFSPEKIEALVKHKETFIATKESDAWATGIALYTLVHLRDPFATPGDEGYRGDAFVTLIHKVERLQNQLKKNIEYAEPGKQKVFLQIISGLLDPNSKTRWTIQKACEYLHKKS